MTRRLAVATALLMVGAAPAVPPALPPLTKVFEVPVPAVESAGPDGAVAGIVVPGGRVAGVVLWPAAPVLDSAQGALGSARLAAQAVLDAALEGQPDAAPILDVGPGAIALGAAFPPESAGRLPGLLAALARPALPPAGRFARTLEALQARGRERWDDPLEAARQAALGALYPDGGRGWTEWPPPASIGYLDAAAARGAIAAVVAAPVGARVAGPSGLAAQVAGALGERAGRLPAPPIAPAPALPASVVVTRALRSPPEALSLAMVQAFRLTPAEVAERGAALLLLAEALRSGEGSLRQRIEVGLGKDFPGEVQWIPAADGGAAFLVAIRIPRSYATNGWRILDGAISSVRSISMREDSLVRARQRLDQATLARRADPAAILLDTFAGLPGAWPPADRWSRPARGADVLAATQKLLAPERRAAAVAGSVPDTLLGSAALKGAQHLAWSRFDPADAAHEGVPGDAEGEGAALAHAVFLALSEGRPLGLEPGFHARYLVRETTPTGPVEARFTLKASVEGVAVGTDSGHWTLEAAQREERSQATLPNAKEGSVSLPQANRLEAFAYREPVLLAAGAMSGAVPSAPAQAPCGEASCEALRVELADGSVLLLVLTPVGKLPGELRIWWPGKDESRPPDETVRYLAWQKAGGVRVAAQIGIEDSLGTARRMELEEWAWDAGSPR